MKDKDTFDYKNRKYNIVPYNIDWQKRFVDEANKIKNIFGKNIIIEHVGSTSVPGMEGKSCIDILVTLKNLNVAKRHISDMEKSGYIFRGEFVKKNALLFTSMKDGVVKTNVHFFVEKNPEIHQMLAIRDFLKNYPEEVFAYSLLKKKLSEQYPNDYGMYRKVKDEYMKKLIKRAKK